MTARLQPRGEGIGGAVSAGVADVEARRGDGVDLRVERAWFKGRTAAFQAAGRGSIPRARSIVQLKASGVSMRQQVRAAAAGALLLTAFVAPTSAVHAATARLSVAPHKVKIGRSMTVSGTSLPPRSYVTFLLAV